MLLDDYPRWQRWLGWLAIVMLTAIVVFFIAGGNPWAIKAFFVGYAARSLSHNIYLAMPAFFAIGVASLVAVVSYRSLLSTRKSKVLVSYEELTNTNLDHDVTIEFYNENEYSGEGIELTKLAFPSEVRDYYNQLDGISGKEFCEGDDYATGLHDVYYKKAKELFQEGDETVRKLTKNFNASSNKNALFIYLKNQVGVKFPDPIPNQIYASQAAVRHQWVVKSFSEDVLLSGMYMDLATPVLLRLWKGTSAIHHYYSTDNCSLTSDNGQIWLWGLEGYQPMRMVWKDLASSNDRTPHVPVELESYQRTLIQQFIMGIGNEDRDHLWYHPTRKTLLCADWQTSWPKPNQEVSVKISSLSLFAEAYRPFLASVKQWVYTHISTRVLNNFFDKNQNKFNLQKAAVLSIKNRIKLLHLLLKKNPNLTPHQLYEQYVLLKAPLPSIPYQERLKAVMVSAEVPPATMPPLWCQEVEKACCRASHVK